MDICDARNTVLVIQTLDYVGIECSKRYRFPSILLKQKVRNYPNKEGLRP